MAAAKNSVTVTEQAQLFWAMMICGAALGAVYDGLGGLRLLLGGGAVSAAAADILFGLLCAGAMIAAGLQLQQDPFRLYAFAGAAAGFAVYMTTLGTIVRYLRRKSYTYVKKS